jgi:hypothetical protein
VEARGQIDVSAGPALHIGLVGPVGIGVLEPVGQHGHQGLELELFGLAHQIGLVPGEDRLGHRGAHLGQGVELGRPDVAVSERFGRYGKVGQQPPPAHQTGGFGLGEMAAGGQPRRGGLGPVDGPLPTRIELGHRRCPHPLETGREMAQLNERIGVGNREGITVRQIVNGLVQRFDLSTDGASFENFHP